MIFVIFAILLLIIWIKTLPSMSSSLESSLECFDDLSRETLVVEFFCKLEFSWKWVLTALTSSSCKKSFSNRSNSFVGTEPLFVEIFSFWRFELTVEVSWDLWRREFSKLWLSLEGIVAFEIEDLLDLLILWSPVPPLVRGSLWMAPKDDPCCALFSLKY